MYSLHDLQPQIRRPFSVFSPSSKLHFASFTFVCIFRVHHFFFTSPQVGVLKFEKYVLRCHCPSLFSPKTDPTFQNGYRTWLFSRQFLVALLWKGALTRREKGFIYGIAEIFPLDINVFFFFQIFILMAICIDIRFFKCQVKKKKRLCVPDLGLLKIWTFSEMFVEIGAVLKVGWKP